MTTLLTDAPIEVAGRRLNPALSPEWQYLLTHFELSEGFSFVVLLVPDEDWANACRIALSRYLEAEGKNLQTVDYSGPEDFKIQVPGRLLELHPSERTGAVWLEATVSEAGPRYEEWAAAWRGMAARLNQFRNPLRRALNVPLVFVGAHWIQPAIRDIAPDLWSVRTLVTRLEPLAEPTAPIGMEAASEQQLEGIAIDPDFALQTAQRLRGQEGKELALAQLLYRAGLGLNARYRWREAESSLREAIDLQRRFKAPASSLADSLQALGYGLARQYDYEKAIAVLNEARPLYEQDGNISGEANCILRLGDIALERSDYATAQARDEEALALYRQVGNVLGETNCILRLGDIARERFDYPTAQARYEEALPLYRRVGSVRGEANCILRLGDIALERSDYATAQVRYEEALPLYRRVGQVLGEANCILRLGHIALERSDYTTSQARSEEALPLYRRMGEVLGEANCILRLGDIALAQERPAEARALFQQALTLYQRISDPYSIGQTHRQLARMAETSEERHEHIDAARAAWTRIDRPDLIEKLEKEFNTNGGQ